MVFVINISSIIVAKHELSGVSQELDFNTAMNEQEYTKYNGQGKQHEGPDHASPYPVSRLAPPVALVDIAGEIARADEMLGLQLEGKLGLIAKQIRSLQEEARELLQKARQDRELHQIRCGFKKKPGKIYHVYADKNEKLLFSLLSPQDWGNKPPSTFKGSYRLEADMSWTRVDEAT